MTDEAFNTFRTPTTEYVLRRFRYMEHKRPYTFPAFFAAAYIMVNFRIQPEIPADASSSLSSASWLQRRNTD